MRKEIKMDLVNNEISQRLNEIFSFDTLDIGGSEDADMDEED